MSRIVLVVAIVAVAAVVAAAMERRRTWRRAPVVAPAPAPQQIDRADFHAPEARYLLVLFSSSTCASCTTMAERIAPLASSSVATDVCEYPDRSDLHEKYEIEAVPVVGLYDRAGVARLTWVGPTSAEELWASVHDLVGRPAP